MLGAAPHARLATPNSASPVRYDDRAPTRTSIGWTMVAETTDPTRYRVVTHA